MIDDKKITSFKVAQICLKTKCYKDELTKMAIKGNLSTQDIKKIKVDTLKDLYKFKRDVKEEHTFTRESSAYRSFINTTQKLKILLKLPISVYPESKKEIILQELNKLEEFIKNYLKK